MQILVVYNATAGSIRAFKQDEDETFLSAFAEIIEERLEEGGWYAGKIELAAESLIDRFDKLTSRLDSRENLEADSKNLSKDMKDFLLKCRLNENGDWDIIDTEN